MLALITLGLPLTACGAAGSSTSASAQTGGGKRPAMLAFARCIRANGVPDFPDPTTGGMRIAVSPAGVAVNGIGVNAPAFRSAMQTCHSKLPNGGQPPPASLTQRAAALKFAQCLRWHGIKDFPDPLFSGGGVRIAIPAGANSPAFKAAQAACGSPIGKAGP